MLNLLHPSELLALHHQLAKSAAITPPTIRDELLIEFACARANLMQYQHPEPEKLFNTTAILTESILVWRPFQQLNAATAFAALQATLALNHHHLTCSPRLANNALQDWNANTNWPTIAKWLSLAAEKI